MLKDMKMTEFLDELASDSPAPGGGSVAALTGAAAAALGEMVCSLTEGKKRYMDVQNEIKEIHTELSRLRKKLTDLMDIDTKAFNLVMEAIRMPKETEEEKVKRKEAMQSAFKRAAEVPMETAETSLNVMKLCRKVLEIGNRNALSDAKISVMMSHLAIKGAALNVRINLDSIEDPEFVGNMEKKLQVIEEKARGLCPHAR